MKTSTRDPDEPVAHAFVVQFPHPGRELCPRVDVMDWNRGRHGRKFMVAPGTYVNERGAATRAQLVFWGEWEGRSRIRRRWTPDPPLPKCLHEPFFQSPTFTGPRQNTDPWVFGHAFRYSNCGQRTNGGRTVTAMQRLTRGSLILFGSSLGAQFVLDTAFVVGQRVREYAPGSCDDEPDEAFRVATLDALCAGRGTDACSGRPDPHKTFTLYEGATPQNPVNNMFSFVPALVTGEEGVRFPRPPVEISGMVNPRNSRAVKGPTRPVPLENVQAAWESIRRQVVERGLVLATQLELELHGARATKAGRSKAQRHGISHRSQRR